MKKIILIFSLFLLTACDSTEIFDKKCTEKVKTDNLSFNREIIFTYNNKDEFLNLTVTDKYQGDEKVLDDIKESALDYNNVLAKKKFAKIQIISDEDDKYQVKYYLDISKMEKNDLVRYDLTEDWIDMNNKIKNSKLDCKN